MTPTEQYKQYLSEHIKNVQKGYRLLIGAEIFTPDRQTMSLIAEHDKSKYSPEEWDAYLNHFYVPEKADEVEFKRAWLHHQHCNPHHPQYWCLQDDDHAGKLEALDMPECYIEEMICDWWSFSLKKGKPDEIHDWYKKAGSKYLMSPKTKRRVEEILKAMKNISWQI